MSDRYKVPTTTLEVETEVKKSRFIARAGFVSTKEKAKLFVAKAKQDYPDARHHCWAYLLGNPYTNASAAMNDAGEPSGTAGKPILNVIQHKKIGDVIVVVIRYFGGIKLGAGGLTRAYSGAAESVLSQVQTEEQTPTVSLKLELDFEKEQLFRHWADNLNVNIGAVEYKNRVHMSISIPEENVEELQALCLANQIELEK